MTAIKLQQKAIVVNKITISITTMIKIKILQKKMIFFKLWGKAKGSTFASFILFL